MNFFVGNRNLDLKNNKSLNVFSSEFFQNKYVLYTLLRSLLILNSCLICIIRIRTRTLGLALNTASSKYVAISSG